MPDGTFAFVDEYGQSDLDTSKEGVSTHFIITAVVVGGREVDAKRVAAEQVRQQLFQTGEMKSASVGKNDART